MQKVVLKQYWIVLFLIFLFGLFLRLFPGKDHFIWSYDQARDVFISESILADKNLVLRGPQTEFYGLTHGPIMYYFLAIPYFISKGDPNLPAFFMMLANLSTILPLFLLARKLTKSVGAGLIAALLFIFAYEQIEYARWILNVSLAIPALTWMWYLWWTHAESVNKRFAVLFGVGICTGLAVQAEIFLLVWIAWVFLYLVLSKATVKSWLAFIGGVTIGALPLVLAEFKFHFLSSSIFVSQFLGNNSVYPDAGKIMMDYFSHIGTTAQFTLFGLSPFAGLIGWVIICIALVRLGNTYSKQTRFLLFLLCSHLVLFFFHYVQAVFLNLGIGIALILGLTYLLHVLWQKGYRIISIIIVLGCVLSQLSTTHRLITSNQPFQLKYFIQSGILFSQKKDVLEYIENQAHLAKAETYSISVLGTPYSVRTVWAHLFRNWHLTNPGNLPEWYGPTANGYGGDTILVKTDHPRAVHFTIIEPNTDLIPQYFVDEYKAQQNTIGKVSQEKTVHGYVIQTRIKY